MTNSSTGKPPIWFWIVSILALIWNGMGAMQYVGQAYMTESFKSQYSAEQLEVFTNLPAWYTAAFAFAVWGGVLGCIGLLLRKKWAKGLFLISLLGIIVQMFHNLFVSDSSITYGPFVIAMTIMIPIVGILLVILSKKAIAKGWII
ncbi:hypothetical protein [Aestuariivivens insulae]|uniref:hypothetical protein n=1 Tax=Aestuariivivens insulae TaxID=1621988 RepID=UPI001F5A4E08|nr:hypothetical protein [Aestuariivivens insulae]